MIRPTHRALAFALALIGLALVLPATGGEQAAMPWREDFDEARAEAAAARKNLWVQFTGPWCLYCRMMDRDAFTRADVVAGAQRQFVAVKVRSDQREDLVAHFGITRLPVTILVDPEGRVIARHDGYAHPAEVGGLLAVAARPVVGPSTDAVALAGYCPVSLVKGVGLTPGKQDHQARHDGRVYRFATAEAREAFAKDPEHYLPADQGRCPVRKVEAEEAVAGSPKFGVHYRGRVYLCVDEVARRRFAADPERFSNLDVADRGLCPVCPKDDPRSARGKPELAASHNGRRYHFHDQAHLEAFKADPETVIR